MKATLDVPPKAALFKALCSQLTNIPGQDTWMCAVE